MPRWSRRYELPWNAARTRQRLAESALRHDVIWALAGNVIFAGCQWAQLLALARFGNPQAVGDFALAVSLAVPIFTLSMLHLRSLQATDAGGDFDSGHYLALRLVTTAAAMFILGTWAGVLRFERSGTGVIWSAIAASTADAISDLGYGVLQRAGRLDRITWSQVVKGPLGLLAVFLAVRNTHGAATAMLGLAATRWFTLLTLEIPLVQATLAAEQTGSSWRPRWQAGKILELARTAFPLGLVMLMVSLQTHLPRMLLERAAGRETLGLFASLVTLAQVGGLAINALGQAASPRLARLAVRGESKAFRRLTLQLLGIATAFGVAGVWVAQGWGAGLLGAVYGPAYACHCDSFVVFMAAAGITYAAGPLGFAATASRRIRWQPLLHAINLACLGGFGSWGARHGLYGMSLAMLASAAIITFLYGCLFCLPSDRATVSKRIPKTVAEESQSGERRE